MTLLTVLDQSPVAEGRSDADAIRQTVALAKACEAMGYHRFWVAEHHGGHSIVGTAPEILTAAIATATSGIRVGPAGILLPRHAPFKVAEQFRVLEALAPGRIDLGIGRSPVGSPAVHAALTRGRTTTEDHGDEVRRLIAWLERDEGAEGAIAFPRGPGNPELWILGSSMSGARLAAELGCPFAFNFSNDILPDGVDAPIALYRDAYQSSARFPRPYLALLTWALAADSDAEADWLFGSRALWRVRLDRQERAPMASAETAAAHCWTDDERARVAGMHARYVVGGIDRVAGRLRDIAARHGADELVINSWAHDADAQLRSYALIADAMISRPTLSA